MAKIGLGTAAIGRPEYINLRHEQAKRTYSLDNLRSVGLVILDEAYNAGVNIFDTAPGYGLSESLLIDWLKQNKHADLLVSTKWGLKYVANYQANPTQHEQRDYSLEHLNEQWAYSKNLLPYLKIYQIHSATIENGVLDDERVLNRLYELKKKYQLTIGLTTTGANQNDIIRKALAIKVESEPLFGSFQSTFNILDASVFEMQDILEQHDHQLIIKESLANGRLIPNTSYPHYSGLYELLKKLAAKYQVGADAIAIRYCMQRFPTSICLVGPSTLHQLQSNLKAQQFILESSDVQLLSEFQIDPTTYWQERKKLTWQ